MPTPPAALTDSVEFARKRIDRACRREADAMHEKHLATRSLEIAEALLASWVEANPDPQMEML